MSIAESTTRFSSTGNGATTNFTFSCPYVDPDDIRVVLVVIATGVEEPQTRGVHYDVVGSGLANGVYASASVNFYTAPPSTRYVNRFLDPPLSNETTVESLNSGAPGAINLRFDELSLQMQALAGVSVKAAPGALAGFDHTVPNAIGQAGALLGVNGDETGLEWLQIIEGITLNATVSSALSQSSLAGVARALGVPFRLASIDALQAVSWTSSEAPHTIELDYNHVPGDGGGRFCLDENEAIAADDGGMVIATLSGLRYRRSHSGPISVKFFGALGDGVSDDRPEIQTTFDYTYGWGLVATTTRTSGFTAAVGYLYPCNTTSAAFTATLPASPAQGDRVGFYDSNNTFDTNNLTVARNGNLLIGAASNLTVNTEGKYVVFEFDTTAGWFYAPNGGKVKFPRGGYRTTAAVTLDQSILTGDSELGRISIEGEGRGSTQILSQHSGRCISFQGDTGNALGAYFSMEDIALRGSGISGSVGLWADNIAFWECNRVLIIDFDYGTDMTDALSGKFDGCELRFNNYNGRMRFSDVSRPNAVAFPDTHITSAYKGGFIFEGASSVKLEGKYSVEGNGITAAAGIFAGGFGLKFIDCGVEGKVGLQAFGGYVEFNAGDADFVFEQSTGSVTHVLVGVGISRISSSLYTTNNIKVTKTGGSIVVKAIACDMGSLGTYVESSARPYVSAPAGCFVGISNTYGSSTAKTVIDRDDPRTNAHHLTGLELSNSSGDATNDFTAAAGIAMDSTNSVLMVLPSAITKRGDAAWAVGDGNGGLDTGSWIDGTYPAYLIQRADTGVHDVILSASWSGPTMPTGYDYWRRIGIIVRSGGAIVSFTQLGDHVDFKDFATAFASDNSDNTTARLRTLSKFPVGKKLLAKVRIGILNLSPTVGTYMLASSPDQNATTPTAALYTAATQASGASVPVSEFVVETYRTDTSAQIRTQTTANDADLYVVAMGIGWIDPRGKDGNG